MFCQKFRAQIGVRNFSRGWAEIAKLLAHRHEPAWIDKQLSEWRKKEHPDCQPFITREAVMDFADAIYDLLRRKFRSEPIAEQASEINRLASQIVYRDNGQYLEGDESFEVYWAIEKRFVLYDLGETTQESEEGWLAAVDECHQCHEFFVKQRRDQIFDNAKCRTTFTNRDAYLRRRKTRRH
jgi:hypothetical protein